MSFNKLTGTDSEGAHHVGGALVVPGAAEDPGAADARVPVKFALAGADRRVVDGGAASIGAASARVLLAHVHAAVVQARLVRGAVGVLHALQFYALQSG